MSKELATALYGDSYNKASKPEKLDDAAKWLNKAIEFDAQGELNAKKTEMALNAAIKAESEAFAGVS